MSKFPSSFIVLILCKWNIRGQRGKWLRHAAHEDQQETGIFLSFKNWLLFFYFMFLKNKFCDCFLYGFHKICFDDNI